ncbi:MAG: hypothetical protein GAK43_02102 [Stenotrophomonas maltophilia]|nr:MAG: hypothetical protein GAK43_02102 [Stenotrophomonas maltophilia]
MRIDGLSSSSVSTDFGSRSGTSVTPYRDVMREAEVRGEQPSSTSATQGLENQAQPRRVEAGSASQASLSSTSSSLSLIQSSGAYQPAYSSRVAQALASYTSTANFATPSSDSPEVLGIDTYA